MNSLFVAEKEFSKDGFFNQDQSRIRKHDSSVFSNIYDQIPERKGDLNYPFDRINNDYNEEDVILINDKSNDEIKSDNKFDSDLIRENMEIRNDKKENKDFIDVIKSYGIDTEDNLMHITQSNNRDKMLDNLDDDNVEDESDDVDARSLSQKDQGKT